MHEGYQETEVLKSDGGSTVARLWCPGKKTPVIFKKLAASERVNTEIELLKSLDHPAIPKLLDTSTNGNITSIILEYKKGQTLDRAFAAREFSEADARYVMKQLVSIVNYLHNTKKVVHRDIKAENIVVDEFNNVSLIDFGFAGFITPDMTERLGSPAFCAPELIRGDPYSELVDIWSLGIVAYLLLAGSLPFEGKTINDTFKSILTDNPVQLGRFRKPVSAPFLDFLCQTLCKDPAGRPSAEDLAKHPWLYSYPEFKKRVFARSTLSRGCRPSCIAKPRRSIVKPHFSTPAPRSLSCL